MIAELLNTGRENTQSARELASILGCGIRDISKQIEHERRQGQPICAASGENPGYYLAADEDELQKYCQQLYKRGGEIFKTRRALVGILKKIQEARENEQSGDK